MGIIERVGFSHIFLTCHEMVQTNVKEVGGEKLKKEEKKAHETSTPERRSL